MYELIPKTRFRRDVKLLSKRKVDIAKLTTALHILQETGGLPEQYRAHPLRGEYKHCMDAHIKPDWVLIYEVDENDKTIILHRTGTHQDLFKNY